MKSINNVKMNKEKYSQHANMAIKAELILEKINKPYPYDYSIFKQTGIIKLTDMRREDSLTIEYDASERGIQEQTERFLIKKNLWVVANVCLTFAPWTYIFLCCDNRNGVAITLTSINEKLPF